MEFYRKKSIKWHVLTFCNTFGEAFVSLSDMFLMNFQWFATQLVPTSLRYLSGPASQECCLSAGSRGKLWDERLGRNVDLLMKKTCQVLPSDLFGCFEWPFQPFQGLSDLHFCDQKDTWKKLVEDVDVGSVLCRGGPLSTDLTLSEQALR